MTGGIRVAGVLPLVGAAVAAAGLAGAAVFTVNHAGCADPGHYEQRGGQVELVGACLDTRDLPAAPNVTVQPPPAAPAANSGAEVNRLQQVRP